MINPNVTLGMERNVVHVTSTKVPLFQKKAVWKHSELIRKPKLPSVGNLNFVRIKPIVICKKKLSTVITVNNIK